MQSITSLSSRYWNLRALFKSIASSRVGGSSSISSSSVEFAICRRHLVSSSGSITDSVGLDRAVQRRSSSNSSSNGSSDNPNSSSRMMTATTLELAEGIVEGGRDCLARAITLIESTRSDHKLQASLLLNYLANVKAVNFRNRMSNKSKAAASSNIDINSSISNNNNNNDNNKNNNNSSNNSDYSLRIGIAGPPGAGKSTFIEALGMKFIAKQFKVAIVPVDPSSHISGGSILGDKTRMEQLSRSEHAYVRASPTKGVLGGIAEHTADVISLCEACNYNVVIVESVGLGQSEVDIDMAVDMLLVIVPPGGGDSLQASKKGIMEAADLIIVNKADGSLLSAAKHTKADYAGAMQFIRQKYQPWHTPVMMMSARTGDGVDDVMQKIFDFHKIMIDAKLLQKKRSDQSIHWMWGQLKRQVIAETIRSQGVLELSADLSKEVERGHVTARAAASDLLHQFYRDLKGK